MAPGLTAEQWRMVWDLFETALDLPAPERRAFIESSDDSFAVRREALALLDETEAGESPVSIAAAGFAFENPSGPESGRIGTQIGRFLITGYIGRGGLGEVYAARDTKLERSVALKFLAPEAIGIHSAAELLIREAKTASALNHPNIITVHEVIQTDSAIAIVMELVDGVPLRRMCEGPLPVSQLMAIGQQIAQALRSAHAQGIVHGDIKPENVIVRYDGQVKVLDFGLARSITPDRNLSVAPLFQGGTWRYLSPEQANAQPLTPANDIFALGIVLYELSCGRHPFAAESPFDTIQAIVTRAAEPPSSSNPAVPPELEDLLDAMLAKAPEKRPSAVEVAEGLDRIASSLRKAREACPRYEPSAWQRRHLALTRSLAGKKRQRQVLMAAMLAGLALLFAAIWIWPKRTLPAGTSLEPVKAGLAARTAPFSSLEGAESGPSFSPDGLRIVFGWSGPNNDNSDIYVKPVGPGQIKRLTSNRAEDFNAVWSPDGGQIAFLRRAGHHTEVLIIPSAGGSERKIGEIAGQRTSRSLMTWAPDGRSIVVTDAPRASQADGLSLFRLPLSGGDRERLTFPLDNNDFAPVYSPDGRSLAFLRGVFSDYAEIQIRSPGGAVRSITSARQNITSLDWTPDGRSILYALNAGGIWRIPATGGASQQALPAEGQIDGLTIARHGNRLAYVHIYEDLNIWRFPVRAASEAPQKFIASSRVDDSPRYSPDGKRITFSSDRSGNFEIWACDSDGSNPVQLTFFRGPLAGSPNWSPDGRTIVFDSPVHGKADIYSVNSTGGPSTQLTFDDSEEILPAWSADGRSIYFTSDRNGDWQIWKMPAQGGPARQVTFSGGFESMESDDGRFLYYPKARNVPGIWRMPVSGGEEKLLPALKSLERFRYWELGRSGIYFVRPYTRPLLEFFNFGTGRVMSLRRLPSPPGDLVRGLSVSPDGRFLLYTQYDLILRQIMLVENIAWRK